MSFKAVLKPLFYLIVLLSISQKGVAQDDPNAQYITLLSGELSAETREIDVPVEVGVLRLQFSVQITGNLAITILTPLGSELSLKEPNVAVSEMADRRVVTMWDPKPGAWKIRFSGTGRFTAGVTAQGELYVCCVQFFVRNGIYTLDRYQPQRGTSIQTQVYASGFNVDTIQFTMVDEQSRLIAPIKFRQSDYSSPSGFSLILETPEQPFRILASGRDVNGKDFQRIFYTIIRPAPSDGVNALNENTAGVAIPNAAMQDLSRTVAAGERKIIRAQIVQWSDQTLVSEKGNPIGIRLKYSMKFPVDGSYSPMPQLYPERIAYGYTGALSMRVFRGSINPPPEGVNNFSQNLFGVRATFKAGVIYEFTVDMIPNYAIYNEQKKVLCTQTRSYNQQGVRERFEREIMSDLKLRFRFSVSGTDFEGRHPALTENVYTPNALYHGIKREGASECN